MDHRISFKKKSLTLPDGEKYKFEDEIAEIIEVKNRVFVRLRIPENKINNENIYCLSLDGELLWQIEQYIHVYEKSSYTGIDYKDGVLTGYNWDGFDVVISPETGKILSKNFTK